MGGGCTEVGRREGEVGVLLQQEREEKEQLSRRYRQVETQLREEREWHLNEERKHLQLLAEKDQIIYELKSLFTASYTCHVSGPGLSATANYPTHVMSCCFLKNRLSVSRCNRLHLRFHRGFYIFKVAKDSCSGIGT